MAAVIIFLAGLYGCKTARTYNVEKPRTDLEIKGNQGYLMGEPKGEPPANRLGTTRKISVLEIELPDAKKAKKAATPGVSVPQEQEEQAALEGQESSSEYAEEGANTEEPAVAAAQPSATGEEYVVQKYDTLQKIAFKFYGTTKKWKYLYDANKDAIKNPDKLYPGMKLIVPPLK